jgi:hypothetical protein
MLIDVHITEVATGETRVYHDDHPWEGHTHVMGVSTAEDAVSFQWGEGNYACDCNRTLFFGWAATPWKQGDQNDPDRECSDGAYRVKITERGTDRVIYEDDA